MAEIKTKYLFKRRILDIKDIVGNTDSKGRAFFLESLDKTPSITNLFSKTERFNVSETESLASANIKAIEKQELVISPNRYYAYLFPSDLVRALSDFARIFSEKDQTLSLFAEERLGLVKRWGHFDAGDETIDEIAFFENVKEIQNLSNLIVSSFQEHPELILGDVSEEKDDEESPIKKKKKDDEDDNQQGDKGGGEEEKPEEDPLDKKIAKSAVVPLIPLVDQASKVDLVLQKDELSRKQKDKIQYEVGWLYNRAVYEMFTAHGIDASDIDPSLLDSLRSDLYGFASDLGDEKLLKMLGSASKRQSALLRFYPKFASENSVEISKFYAEISSKLSYQKLTPEQQEKFKEFHNTLFSNSAAREISATELLKESLKDATGSDSAVLNKNVQNTLDAMILQYGIDQEFRDENGEIISIEGSKNNHDVIKIIDGMSDDKLRIIFGLSDGMNSEQIGHFKTSIKNYSIYRASELTFHIQDTTLSKGLAPVDSNSQIGADQHNFMDSTRVAIEKNSAETVVGGIEGKTGKDENSRRKDKISKLTKQYKSFIPLWENLQPEEQRIVYNKFGIPFNGANKDAPLQFIPEFLFFDVSTLRTFKNIRNSDKLTAAEQEAALADYENVKNDGYFEVGDQLEMEQAYGHFINDSYLYNMDPDQLLLMADFINNGEALDGYPTAEFFEGYSPRELMELDLHIQETGYEISEPNKRIWNTTSNNQPSGEDQFESGNRGRAIKKVSNKITNSKPYQRLTNKLGLNKKKLNPSKRMANSLGKSAASKVFKGVSVVSNVILPGSGKILYEIGRKVGFKRTMAIAGSLLSLLIAKTIYALSTIGGLIGGVVGSVIGFFAAGGPVGIVPGLIIGANIGQALWPANWFNAMFGGEGAGSVPASEAALANASANNSAVAKTAFADSVASQSEIFLGLPIAILAPGISMFIGIAVTVHTIFTIQAAFLTPLPTNLSAIGGGLVLGEFACFQLMPGGTSIDAGAATLTSLDWDQASIDLFKGGLAEVAANSTYVGLLCGGGPIALYKLPSHPAGFYGWAKDANTMILYGGAFSNAAQMEYLVIHESSHIIDNRNSGLLSSFAKNITTSTCYTYPIPSMCGDGEAFAEGIALYVTSDRFVGNLLVPGGSWPFKSNHGKDYQWIKQNIFGGQEYQ